MNGAINSANVYFYGDEGDDTFDLTNVNASSHFTIVGGEGTNTVIGQVPQNVIAADIVGGNVFSVDFAANETKEILINGIKYTVQTKYDSAFVYYLNDDGSITFAGSHFTIRGEEDKAHNVVLQGGQMTFHGGNLADKIVVNQSYCSVYGGDGDDEIIVNRGIRNLNGEGGNDHIVVTSSLQADSYVTGGDGDDTIDVKGTAYNLHGGSGNDVFNLLNSAALDSIIDCGEGDDTVNNQTSDTASNITLMGGAGTNTLNGKFDSVMISGFGDDVSEAKDVSFAAGETKEITINGKKYKVTNTSTEGNTFQYYYNPLTDEITFGGHKFDIYAQEDVEHDIILRTNDVIFHGGSKNDKISIMQIGNDVYGLGGDDTIIVNGSSNWVSAGDGNDKIYVEGTSFWNTIYGSNGDDEIFINAVYNNSFINLGNGNDTYHINYSGTDATMNDLEGDNTYYVNADNTSIASGAGNDTFIINGSNNTILGQGGDDYYEINGNNNTIDGGTGTNYIVDKGGSNNKISNVQTNPNSGFLTFNAQNEVQEFQIDGKKYTITNNANSSPANQNRLYYNYNQNTGELTFTGDNFTIQSSDNTAHNLVIEGSNNTVSGGNKNDKITVNKGSNNIIKGGDGNDSLTSNSENNSLKGENGSDTINVNATTNQEINGGAGNDIINVNSNNNTNVQAGSGNDNIKIIGSNNTVNGNDGNNTIIATGNNNNITAENGDNRLSAIGNLNTITSGSGNNTLGVDGENNSITSNGQDTINIYGNSNTTTAQYGKEINITGNKNNVTTTQGNNSIKIKGDENIYQGGSGQDKVTINGNNNTANGGQDNDYFQINKGENNTIDGNEGNKNTMVNYGQNTKYTNVLDITPDPVNLRFQVGANSDNASCIKVSIDFKFVGFELDYSSAETAAQNIEIIDELQKEISGQNATLGAVINRLQSTLELQTTQIENLTASVSTIMDADIAQESAEYVKNRILTQTAAALMSVSSTNRSEVLLELIRGV